MSPKITEIPIQEIEIDKLGHLPLIDIGIKVPHLGTYEIALWNAARTKGKVFRTGNTADSIADEFRIITRRAGLPKLNNRVLTWLIMIQRVQPGSQHPWSFTFELTQGGVVLDRVKESGPMNANVVGFLGSYALKTV